MTLFPKLALSAMLILSSFQSAGAECLRGINLSGAEFGKPGGRINKDYVYPGSKTVHYFAAKGFDSVRLPFMWERLQPTLMQPFDKAELNRLREAVALIRSEGMTVVLDPHNYARYHGQLIGSADVPVAAFADFWARLAGEFANRKGVHFGLMNEPNRMNTGDWLVAANAAIEAIRMTAGAGNLILVPGNSWTGAHSWKARLDGGSNAKVMTGVADPANNYAFEVHQYFDEDFSGTKGTCSRAADAIAALSAYGDWLRKQGARGYLGEFGVPGDPACVEALAKAVGVVEANRDVWIGWSYWVAGDWWPEKEPLNIQPTAKGDRPQLAGLQAALAAGSCPAP